MLIIVFHENSFGFNVSARGTGMAIHCGFLMSALAKQVSEKFNNAGTVSGGGHAKAGECVIPAAKISRERAMKELTTLIQEVTLIDDLSSRGTLTRSASERAKQIGLTYITKD